MAFLASMRLLRSAASDSLTVPAAYAFHKSAETFGNSTRGAASMARRSCSANMPPPRGQSPAGRGVLITGQASPLPKVSTFSLTRGRVFGESQIARSLPRLRPACDPPLKAGFVFLGLDSPQPKLCIRLLRSAGVKQAFVASRDADRPPGLYCFPEHLSDDGRNLPVMGLHHG